MKTNILKYNVLIKKEDKYFVAFAPTLGISDFGKTVDLAKKNLQEAMLCHIEGLIKTKTEIPLPDTGEFFIGQTEVTLPQSLRLAL